MIERRRKVRMVRCVVCDRSVAPWRASRTSAGWVCNHHSRAKGVYGEIVVIERANET